MRKFFTDRTPPGPHELANIYDTHAPSWLSRAGRAETRLVSERWRNELVQTLRGDVLEIGVAAGDSLLRISEYGKNVTSFTGIDLSPSMIAQAENAAEKLQIPISLEVANAEDLSKFVDQSFDTVTASLVFCTVHDVPKALAEIARVLRPNGKLVVIEHVLSPNRVIAKLQKLVAPQQIRKMGCHLDRQTVQTLEHCGYRIQEQRMRIFGIMRFVIALSPV